MQCRFASPHHPPADLRRRQVLAVAFAAVAGAAMVTPIRAQSTKLRNFPANVQTALFQITSGSAVVLNEKVQTYMAVGSRIYDANNRLVLPAKIIGQRFVVNFVADKAGLRTVWILNSAEVALYYNKKRPPKVTVTAPAKRAN